MTLVYSEVQYFIAALYTISKCFCKNVSWFFLSSLLLVTVPYCADVPEAFIQYVNSAGAQFTIEEALKKELSDDKRLRATIQSVLKDTTKKAFAEEADGITTNTLNSFLEGGTNTQPAKKGQMRQAVLKKLSQSKNKYIFLVRSAFPVLNQLWGPWYESQEASKTRSRSEPQSSLRTSNRSESNTREEPNLADGGDGGIDSSTRKAQASSQKKTSTEATLSSRTASLKPDLPSEMNAANDSSEALSERKIPEIQDVFYVFNVGQGNCNLFIPQDPASGVILYDAGRTTRPFNENPESVDVDPDTISSIIAEALRKKKKQHLEVVVSHSDEDHLSILRKIVESVKKSNPGLDVVFNFGGKKADYNKREAKPLIKWVEEQSFKKFFASPERKIPYEYDLGLSKSFSEKILSWQDTDNPNSNSVVLRISKPDKYSILLTGDGEESTFAQIENKDVEFSTVMVAAHHGANTNGSNSQEWVMKVLPRHVVFSSCYSGKHHHPPTSEVVTHYLDARSLETTQLHVLSIYKMDDEIFKHDQLRFIGDVEIGANQYSFYLTKKGIFHTLSFGTVKFSFDERMGVRISSPEHFPKVGMFPVPLARTLKNLMLTSIELEWDDIQILLGEWERLAALKKFDISDNRLDLSDQSKTWMIIKLLEKPALKGCIYPQQPREASPTTKGVIVVSKDTGDQINQTDKGKTPQETRTEKNINLQQSWDDTTPIGTNMLNLNISQKLTVDTPNKDEGVYSEYLTCPTIGDGDCFFHAAFTEDGEDAQSVSEKAATMRNTFCDAIQSGEYLDDCRPLLYEHYLEFYTQSAVVVPKTVREMFVANAKYEDVKNYLSSRNIPIPTELTQPHTEAAIKSEITSECIKSFMERFRQKEYISVRRDMRCPAEIIAEQSGKRINIFLYNKEKLTLFKSVGSMNSQNPPVNILLSGEHYVRLYNPQEQEETRRQAEQITKNVLSLIADPDIASGK